MDGTSAACRLPYSGLCRTRLCSAPSVEHAGTLPSCPPPFRLLGLGLRLQDGGGGGPLHAWHFGAPPQGRTTTPNPHRCPPFRCPSFPANRRFLGLAREVVVDGRAPPPGPSARSAPEEGARDLALIEALLESAAKKGQAVAVAQI